MSKFKSLAIVLALIFVFASVFGSVGNVALAADGTRLSGADRYETAAEISAAGWDTSEDVVLASGEDFPDGLAGAPLATVLDAPLLLTGKDEVPDATLDEIERLGAKNIYILGGTGAVSEAVEEALADYTVTRLAGEDRYATAVEIAEEIKALGGSVDKVILATGLDYPDALAAGVAGLPILFTEPDALNAATQAAIEELGVEEVSIVGGTGVVSDAVENALEDLGLTVDRVAGADRELTALEVAKAFAPEATGAILATGYDFADALAAGPFAAKNGLAMFLTSKDSVYDDVLDYIAESSIKADSIYVAGGAAVVSDDVLADVVDAATPAALAVESVAAVKANTLKVTFNKAVEDTSKAVFTVKKGSTTVVMNAPTWNEDKTEATLVKASSNFSAGDYTVTVSGLDNLDPAKSSVTITLQDQTVTTIAFVGSDLVKAADNQSATFRYVVKDQYGTDITKSVSLNASSSLGVVPALDASKGIGEITYDFAQDVLTKTVVVTLVHPQTGVSATATLNVAAAANITSFTFGEVKLPSGASRITIGKATAATVPVTAVDQYGNVIKDVDTLDAAINLISSDSNVAFTFTTDSDNNPVINVDTSALAQAAKVVLTVIVKANGNAYTKIFDISKPAEPYIVTLGDISAEIIAAGDTSIALPITVKDQFGEELTAAQIADNAAAINSMISGGSSDANAIISNPTVVTDRNSANYGKLAFDAKNKGTAIIVATSKNGTVSTKTVTVKDARVTTDVIAPANINLMQGATATLKFALYDQYGAKISSPKDDDTLNPPPSEPLSYKVTLTKVSGDDGAVDTTFTLTGTNETLLTSIPVAAAADKTGSYKVTAELIKDGKTVSSASVVVTVVKNNQSGLTYSIDAIPTLAGDQDYNSGSQYARSITVRAKDAAGTEYVINPADIIDITSSDDTVAAVDPVSKKVFGQNITGNNNTADKKATITVKLNTLDGIKTVSTEVTVSPNKPVVQEVRALNNSIANKNSGTPWKQDSLPSGLSNKLTYEGTQASFTTGVAFYLVGKDQYGVWQDYGDATVVVNSTNYAAVDAFTLAGGKLTLSDANGLTLGKDILATVMLGNGSVQITINVTQ